VLHWETVGGGGGAPPAGAGTPGAAIAARAKAEATKRATLEYISSGLEEARFVRAVKQLGKMVCDGD
jgi:hypothetical protein